MGEAGLVRTHLPFANGSRPRRVLLFFSLFVPHVKRSCEVSFVVAHEARSLFVCLLQASRMC